MRFSSQSQAKKFFIEKIKFQTQKDHVSLSEAEEYMLAWSEEDKGFLHNQELTDKFNEETTENVFEKKVIQLIKKAYKEDLRNDPSAKETYQSAYLTLCKGDHYLLVMLDEALDKDPSASWIKDKLLLVATALGLLVGMILFIGFPEALFGVKWGHFISSCIFYLGTYFTYSYIIYIKIKSKEVSLLKLFTWQLFIASILIVLSFLVFYYDLLRTPENLKVFIFVMDTPLLVLSILVTEYCINKLGFFLKEPIMKSNLSHEN
jgi:hypothetical protein